MKEFSQLAKPVRKLDRKEIWAYMLEIATVFASAAIRTILDERYSDPETDLHELFMEKFSKELN